MNGLLTKPLDKRWVDVTLAPNGYPARGCRPADPSFKTTLADYEEVFSANLRDHPRTDWDDLLKVNCSLETLVRWIHDQKQEGTCASNAVCGVHETCLSMTVGSANGMMLSPIGVYRWVASGPNSGSGILENIERMQTVGTLPVDTPENRARLKLMGLPETHVLQHTGYYQAFPTGWEDTAAYFRIEEAYRAATFDGCVSGLFDGFALHYGRAGHSIFGVAPVKQGSTYYVKYGNSWGPWGEVGVNGLQMFGYDSESFLRQAIVDYDAVLVRSVALTDAFLKAMRGVK
jgi:hypothetical protein